MSKGQRSRAHRRPMVITDPYLVDKISAVGSPVGEAMHDYASGQVARIYRPDSPAVTATQEENAMPIPEPPPAATYVTRADLRSLESTIEIYASVVDDMTGRMAKLEDRLQELRDRLDAMPVSRNEVTDRVVRFLESHPGIKFSPASVAQNLQGIDRADQALKRLAGAGRISVDARPGRRPMYFING